jgi:hypothetical protein
MSGVIVAPELISSAATDLADIGSALSAAHPTAAASTATLLPAAADEILAGIAHLFSAHAQSFQALAGQAAVFHEQFTKNLIAGAGSYAATEGTIIWFFIGPIVTPIIDAIITALLGALFRAFTP